MEQIGGQVTLLTVPGGATLIDFSLIASFIGAGSLLPLAFRYSWRAAVGSRGKPLGPKVIANLTVTFALGFVAGTLVVGLAGVGLGDAPPLGFGFGGVVGAGVTLIAVT